MRTHGESLDAKAGVILGFAGVLVGFGATTQPDISQNWVFRAGLGAAVLAALLAVWAFIPRPYPVLQVRLLRDEFLTATEAETKLSLLDTQIEMITQAAEGLQVKGRKLSAGGASLALAVLLVMVGTLAVGGHTDVGKPGKPHACSGQRSCFAPSRT